MADNSDPQPDGVPPPGEDDTRWPDFPLLGLGPDWIGPRYRGGALSSGSEVEALSVIHGSIAEGRGRQLIVETARSTSVQAGDPLRVVAEHIWHRSRGSDSLPDLDDEEIDLLNRVRSEQESVAVEGTILPLSVVTLDEQWIGRTQYKGWMITVQAKGFRLDGLRLVTVQGSF